MTSCCDAPSRRTGNGLLDDGRRDCSGLLPGSEAVAAARDAQEALAAVLPVRMGIHTGETESRDGDYSGTTVNRCARLMAAAHGGQVVVSAATEAVVRDALGGEVELVDLGDHRLRDLAAALQGATRRLALAASEGREPPAGQPSAQANASPAVVGLIGELRRQTTRRLVDRLGDSRLRDKRAEGGAMDTDHAVARALALIDRVLSST